MSTQHSAAGDSSQNHSCRGNCPGYGTHSFCPPLIVLAMHSQQTASEYALDQSRHPLNDESTQETSRAAHFSGTVASGGYCSCMSSNLGSQSFVKSQM
jgi:predicted metal-binding protein